MLIAVHMGTIVHDTAYLIWHIRVYVIYDVRQYCTLAIGVSTPYCQELWLCTRMGMQGGVRARRLSSSSSMIYTFTSQQHIDHGINRNIQRSPIRDKAVQL